MTELPSVPPSVPPPAFPRRRLRWALPPLAAVVLLGGFGLAPTLAGTEAPPTLPAISTQDLVAKALGAESIAGFTGTLDSQTDLGLPSLGSLGPQSSNLLTTLIAPHTIKVWYANGGKVRLAISDDLAETDIVSDGTQVWVWQSATQTVSHVAEPGGAATPDKAHEAPDPNEPPRSPEDMTPPALASRLLASSDATTRVFVRGTASVAGRPAYELVLAPKATGTLVSDAMIDVDAATGLPLRVQVLAKDSGTPALQVGFTSLSLNVPDASNFTFAAPPGATVREVSAPEELLYGPSGDRYRGEHVRKHGPKGAAALPPAPEASAATPGTGTAPAGKRQVIGSGWDAVAVLPNAPGELARLGTAVSGPWGSGRLVTSKLVDALILPDGRMLVGMVGADTLEAAVAQLGTGS